MFPARHILMLAGVIGAASWPIDPLCAQDDLADPASTSSSTASASETALGGLSWLSAVWFGAVDGPAGRGPGVVDFPRHGAGAPGVGVRPGIGAGAPGAGIRAGAGVGAPGVGVRPGVGAGAPGAGIRSGLGAGAPGVGVRPGIGAGAPGAGIRSGIGIGAPGVGVRPGIGAGAPGIGVRPGIGAGAPGIGVRPGIGAGAPGIGVRPGIGAGAPGIGVRPGIGAGAPGIGVRPGIGAGAPGIGVRPGIGAGAPGIGVLPGLGAGRPGIGNRPNWANRPFAGTRQDLRQQHLSNLHDRFQNRDDWINNRLNRREDWIDDWEHWHHDWYYGAWHSGYWPPYWGPYWNYLWDEYPVAMAFGLTRWGINHLAYLFGYYPYYNPYYVTPGYPVPMYLDYSQPLVVTDPLLTSTTSPTGLPPGVTDQAVAKFDQARQAFYDGQYSQALNLINEALAEAPRDTAMHEFRALTLFALGQYRDAAATLHPVLAVGPGWDWTTLSGMYPSVSTYTQQLRALESYSKANPQAADAHFLLAYHYITCGHTDASASQLRRVQELMPQDEVAQQLLEMLTGERAPGTAAPPPPPAEAPAIPAMALQGAWTAQGTGNAQFALTLGDNNEFTWTFQQGPKKQTVEGVYALDGQTLALQPDSGGVMLAQITPPQNNQFHFQMVGGPAGDMGLNFHK